MTRIVQQQYQDDILKGSVEVLRPTVIDCIRAQRQLIIESMANRHA